MNAFSTLTRDPVNDERPTDPAPPLDPLFIPEDSRLLLPHRIRRGDATPAEIVHHLLGANADDTLTGALNQAQIFAQIVAQHLESDRLVGTMANHLVAILDVCMILAERSEEGRAA